MNSSISVIILAGGFSTSLSQSYPGIPKALIPLGHNPCICILIETLLELSFLIDKIYILVFERHRDLFQKEIDRWFMSRDNIILIIQKDPQGTAKSLESFLLENSNVQENLLILHSNMPLLSKTTLKDFVNHVMFEKMNNIMLVGKIKNHSDYSKVLLLNEKVKKVYYMNIENEEFGDRPYCFLNTFFIKKNLLLSLLSKLSMNILTNEFDLSDIVEHFDEGFDYFVVNPFVANKECIIIKRMEDKNFAEEVYLEYRNAMFIHQCYGLWKKCETFENRLHYIEEILKKYNMIS